MRKIMYNLALFILHKKTPNLHIFGRRGVGRMVRWCPGVLLIWKTVGQGPNALAVGAGGDCLNIFTLVCHFSLLFPSQGNGPI